MRRSRSVCAAFAAGAMWLLIAQSAYAVDAPAGGANAGEEAHFVVTLVKKDERHPWHGMGLKGRGNEMAFAIDGIPGRELTLVRNQPYVFDVRSTPQHEFYISTDEVGRGIGVLTEGVEGTFVYEGTVRFTPDESTPDIVFYHCQNHTYMGGPIYIVDRPGQEPERKFTPSAETRAVDEPEVDPEKLKRSVSQKLMFASMVMRSSANTKRVAASGNEEAKAVLEEARGMITDAKAKLDEGSLTEAKELVDEAIRQANRAFELVPDSGALKKQAMARFDELRHSIATLLVSYRESRNQAIEQGRSAGTDLDVDTIRDNLGKAQGMADEEDYHGAVNLLEEDHDKLVAATNELLDSQTVTYDRNFATKKEEYRYEQGRNREFARLVGTAIDELKPSEMVVKLMNRLTDKGDALRSEAEQAAESGDFDTALEILQKSTSKYEGALKMAGVR